MELPPFPSPSGSADVKLRGQDKPQRPVTSPPGGKGLPGLEGWEITTPRGVFSGRDEA